MARLTERAFSTHYLLEAHFFMVNSNDGIKTEASIDYVMDTWNPECLRTVADWLNITKSILFRVYRRILVERLPTIFPVNIWSTYLFEIKHRWAKWLISDTSPKGTRRISDLMIRLQITQISDPMNPSPEWIWSITDLKMDLLEKNVTDQKSWSGFSQRNALLNCHSRFHLSLYHPLIIYLFLMP